ncbi:MAG TPA: hypothetical protein VGD65_12765 [Chryseosolibacter sp.]
MISQVRWIFLAVVMCLPGLVLSQEKDSVAADTTKRNIIETIKGGRVSKRLLKSITRKKQTNPTAAVRSEDAFMPFEGKIIRKIEIRHIGFDKTVYDTTRNIRNTITRVSKALHSNSREWLIRDHLFIRENRPLSPYKMADNERYLRDLDFILDSKIYVVPLRNRDSVDVVVLTRDVFSLGGSFNPSSPTKTRFRLYDTNLGGWGQRVQFNGLIEDGRDPAFIYEALYRKNSIGGSFVNGTIGYTQLNNASSYGDEEEKAYYIRLDRPLVSPYTTFAGGMEISRNWSENFFHRNDTLFRNYRYVVNDFWVGYNIGVRNNSSNRSRHFVAIRAFDQKFIDRPAQQRERETVTYNDRSFVLGGLTFFKQNFYTASYIYGFGRTEDVPYGHSMSLYLGWSRELHRKRPYVGLEFEKAIVTRRNEFYNIALRTGGYHNNKKLEDGIILLSGSMTSRLIPYGELLMRQSFTVDYTRVFRQQTTLPLDINNEFGLRYFVADSLWGTKRFHVNTETLVFTPISLAGFRFAPFGFGEMAMINDDSKSIFSEKPYFGFGGGVRTRNENLVFGTIELRFVYFPRVVEDMQTFAIRVSSNLRVKYSAGFVKPPGFVRFN